jgi:hypothetical protein
LVLAGLVAAIIVQISPFDEPRPLFNAWFQLAIVAVCVGLLLWASYRVRSRLLPRLQLSVLLSLLVHLLLCLMLGSRHIHVVVFNDSRQDVQHQPERLVTLPHYDSDVQSGEPFRYLQEPAAASPMDQEPTPDLQPQSDQSNPAPHKQMAPPRAAPRQHPSPIERAEPRVTPPRQGADLSSRPRSRNQSIQKLQQPPRTIDAPQPVVREEQPLAPSELAEQIPRRQPSEAPRADPQRKREPREPLRRTPPEGIAARRAAPQPQPAREPLVQTAPRRNPTPEQQLPADRESRPEAPPTVSEPAEEALVQTPTEAARLSEPLLPTRERQTPQQVPMVDATATAATTARRRPQSNAAQQPQPVDSPPGATLFAQRQDARSAQRAAADVAAVAEAPTIAETTTERAANRPEPTRAMQPQDVAIPRSETARRAPLEREPREAPRPERPTTPAPRETDEDFRRPNVRVAHEDPRSSLPEVRRSAPRSSAEAMADLDRQVIQPPTAPAADAARATDATAQMLKPSGQSQVKPTTPGSVAARRSDPSGSQVRGPQLSNPRIARTAPLARADESARSGPAGPRSETLPRQDRGSLAADGAVGDARAQETGTLPGVTASGTQTAQSGQPVDPLLAADATASRSAATLRRDEATLEGVVDNQNALHSGAASEPIAESRASQGRLNPSSGTAQRPATARREDLEVAALASSLGRPQRMERATTNAARGALPDAEAALAEDPTSLGGKPIATQPVPNGVEARPSDSLSGPSERSNVVRGERPAPAALAQRESRDASTSPARDALTDSAPSGTAAQASGLRNPPRRPSGMAAAEASPSSLRPETASLARTTRSTEALDPLPELPLAVDELTPDGPGVPIARTADRRPDDYTGTYAPGANDGSDSLSPGPVSSEVSPSASEGSRRNASPAGVTRRAAELPLELDAEQGPGGLSVPRPLRPGLPNRRARPDSQVVHLDPQRFQLDRTEGQLAIDGRITEGPLPAFQNRDRSNRREEAQRQGGNEASEQAVELGLAFLARHQKADGHWSLHELGVDDPAFSDSDRGSMQSDSAATALALLAYLGAGYTHRTDKYQQVVQRGLEYLLTHQSEQGELFTGGSRVVRFYSHGIASIALCEAYGMTRDARLRQPAQRALDYIMATQHPELGGWRYRPRVESDTSVSGWQIMALKSGELAGLSIDQGSYLLASHWLDTAQASPQDASRYVYLPGFIDRNEGKPSLAMSAEGMLMRLYLGWQSTNPHIRRGADYLMDNVPKSGTSEKPLRDAYYWYYATQVMFQMKGEHWQQWNRNARDLLVKSQIREGALTGSWSPNEPVPDRWAGAGGRLYVTAMHLLILEVYYRHLPIYRSLEE